MKVVIDTNILVSIISKRSPFRWVFDCIIAGKMEICVSTEILLEYKEILQSKTTHFISENIMDFLSASPFVEKTEVFYKFNLIEKDNSDNKFVDCAISGDALCIISNDKHFQVLKSTKFPTVKLFTLEEFGMEYKSSLI